MKKEFMLQVKSDGEGKQIVSGRDLHEYLGVGRDFTTWIKERIEKYQFEENADFTIISIAPRNGGTKKGGQNKVDYIIKLDMAKELSMIENNDRGREARKYFIECENKLFDIPKQLKQSCSNLKKIEVDEKFDWAIKRMRDRADRSEHIENLIAYLFELLKKEYTTMNKEIERKITSCASNFWSFKTDEEFDLSKEPLPFIVEAEIEKELAEKINDSKMTNEEILEKVVKILEQKKLTNKE